jgi:hypothetical protein
LEALVRLKKQMTCLDNMGRRWGDAEAVELKLDWMLKFDGDTDVNSTAISYLEAKRVFKAIRVLPLVAMVLQNLGAMVQEVVKALMLALNIKAIRVVGEGDLASKLGRPFADVCDLFISVKDAMHELRGFRRVLVEEGQITSAVALYKVLLDLVRDAGDILYPKVNVYFGDLFRVALQVDLGLSVSQAMRVLGMFCLVQSIALAIGYLKMNGFAAKSGYMLDHTLKREVDAALAYMDVKLHELAELLAQPEIAEIEGMNLPLAFTISEASGWVKAAKLFASSAKRVCVVAMLDHSYTLADSVAKGTPQYAHFVNHKAYHPKLANKYLLRLNDNDKFTTETVALADSMTAVQAAHSHWRLEPPFEQDPEFAVKRAYCQSAFTEAKKASVIIAAVVLIEESSGDKGKLAATALLAKRKDQLPATIVERLSCIAGLTWHGVATETEVVVQKVEST